MTTKNTVWFGSKPSALGRECPACGARVGKPCISRVGMPGTCVSAGLVLTGMHFERISTQVEVTS